MIKLSIITVTYKDLLGLEDTFKSIKTCLTEEVEWIVVNGNPNDKSDKFLMQISENSKKVSIISELDNGIYDAMNKGLKLAKGEMIWFLNSGDICLLQREELENIIYSKYFNEADILKFSAEINNKIHMEKISFFFLIFNTPNHQSLMVRKSIHDNFDTNLALAADYHNFYKIFLNSKLLIRYIEKPLIKYELTGKTALKENKNIIRIERMRAVLKLACINKINLIPWITLFIQLLFYTPYLLFPGLNIKRFRN